MRRAGLVTVVSSRSSQEHTARRHETIRVGAVPFVVRDDPSELWVASFMGDDVRRIRPH